MTAFMDFWSLYPRKQAKKDAEKAWESLKCEPIAAQIVAGLKRQLHTFTDPKYIPLPASWLRSGRWEDQLHIEVRPGTEKAPPGPVHEPWRQHDPWRALLNAFMVKIVSDRGGVELEQLRAMVRERNNQAAALALAHGPEVPPIRPIAALESAWLAIEGAARG
jgi:hypothetical protein